MAKTLFDGGESYVLTDDDSLETTHKFQTQFRDHVLAEPGLRGQVLDIGCGAELPPFLIDFCAHCQSMDGVDPDPAIMRNPALRQRWNAPLEKAEVPVGQYDVAFAYNVVEHIPRPREFFEHVRRVLKPGGVFWALTPHRRHPFTWLARAAELVKLKPWFHRRDPGVNTYSSYYRANSARQVLEATKGLGFKELRVYYYPAIWKQYFPRGLQWVAGVYDFLVGYRVPRRMLIIAYRLEVQK